MSAFNITVSSKSANVAHIAVFVNPSSIVQSGHTIYADMFPVAWEVFDMPAVPPGNIPVPVTVEYLPALTAFCAGSQLGSNVTGKSVASVIPPAKTFQVTDNQGIAVISILPFDSNADVAIINSASKVEQLGIGDSQGNPYMVLSTAVGDIAEFVSKLEFAVVVVENVVQGSVFEGDTRKPWISFQANTVTDPNGITITYDGQAVTGSGAQFIQHKATEKVFGQSLGGPSPDSLTVTVIVAFSMLISKLSDANFRLQVLQIAKQATSDARITSIQFDGKKATINYQPINLDDVPDDIDYSGITDKIIGDMMKQYPEEFPEGEKFSITVNKLRKD